MEYLPKRESGVQLKNKGCEEGMERPAEISAKTATQRPRASFSSLPDREKMSGREGCGQPERLLRVEIPAFPEHWFMLRVQEIAGIFSDCIASPEVMIYV